MRWPVESAVFLPCTNKFKQFGFSPSPSPPHRAPALNIREPRDKSPNMSFKNCIGITIQELKLKIEDMSESEEDIPECVSNNHTAVGAQNQNLGEEDGDKKDDIFFEGAEKLLEIWFTTKSKVDKTSDLRSIPR